MKVLRLVPLVLVLAACSFEKVPLSPYRIDVQQGNALEQESVEKLRVGLNRSQVRFLLGTPLLVDPFRNNRWDYVYNFRKAGKLTEERRLVLFFNGDVLVRIEAEGFPPKGELPAAKPAATPNPAPKPVEPEKPAEATPAAAVRPSPAPESANPAPTPVVESARPAPAAPVQPPAAVQAAPVQAPAPVAQPKPTPASVQVAAVPAASAGDRGLNETSIVSPLQSGQANPAQDPGKPVTLSGRPPETVALQAAVNVDAIKPDVVPQFTKAAAAASPEEQITLALNAWAEAWRSRNEEAYLAAYAASFRPDAGQSREEWEKRRRLLLGITRSLDLQIDGVAIEVVAEDRAQVSFRQFYRSDTYQDAVIKQLKFVRVDNLWLIEEEKVLAPIKGKK